MQAMIRAATAGDMERIAQIYRHYVTGTVITFDTKPPDVAGWREKLRGLTGHGLPFLVADAGGEVAGYAYAAPWKARPAYRHTVEDSIYLAPGWTGRGLGRLLLEALLGACAEAGVRQIIAVIADTGDAASAALHARSGFTHAGRLTAVGHKHGRWIDTVLMQRDLTSGCTGG